MPKTSLEAGKSYTNPVSGRPFPDPFVLKYRGTYFAYCTGLAADGRVFGRMRSPDLVEWHDLDGAMKPLDIPYPHYWAPEVTQHNGKFYLYYSVGNEKLMEIRVAVADAPDGDFLDAGMRLTDEEFAIDPHVVIRDGVWYMFYATDFLDHSHIGTGTVVDLMLDPFILSKSAQPVTRAKYDWQVYDPAREEKGGVRWHTVEGPFVLERKGLNYQMFSGGNWQNETYGVSYAVSPSIMHGDEWEQHSDGVNVLPALRTVPGRVLGPGHNSVVSGPNNRELYCVYHRWAGNDRVMAIDRIDFSGPGELFVDGPTDSPQPFPRLPKRLAGPGKIKDLNWRAESGMWLVDSSAHAKGKEEGSYEINRLADFRCDLWARSMEKDGLFGFGLRSGSTEIYKFFIDAHNGVTRSESIGGEPSTAPLPGDFDTTVFHEITLDLNAKTIFISIDKNPILTAYLTETPSSLMLLSDGAGSEFGPVDVTYGFEELFETGDLGKRGWTLSGDISTTDNGLLKMGASGADQAVLSRNVEPEDFELCINLRFAELSGLDSRCSLECGNVFAILPGPNPKFTAGDSSFALPQDYDPRSFNQYRILSVNSRADAFIGSSHIGSVSAEAGDRIGLTVHGGEVDIDMVRYTTV